MLIYTSKDVVEILKKSKNINSAIKSFLKKEVKKGDPAEKFAKSLKVVLLDGNFQRAISFIDANLAKFENHLFVIGQYAFSEFTSSVTDELIEKYADSFNETYKIEGGELEILNRADFSNIVKSSLKLIDDKFREFELPSSPFLKKLLIMAIFHQELHSEIESFLS